MKARLDFDFCASARKTLTLESEAVSALVPRIGEEFFRACQLIINQTDDAIRGRVVVTGIGKSGHIARKIASTLASTGSPALFMHPAEASHGDLGMIAENDVVIALSSSGESPEIASLLPILKRKGVSVIALTGNPESTLAQHANIVIDVRVKKEACPLNLAPTASTTATLAMGDALAISLLEARGFNAQDFARFHPGGNLGRRLLLTVDDVMRKGKEIPKVSPEDSVRVCLFEITAKGLGFATVVDHEQHLLGLYTDGDLRRTLDRNLELDSTPMVDVMSRDPITVPSRMLAAEALRIMEQNRITALAVVDSDGLLVGALKLQDLLNRNVL